MEKINSVWVIDIETCASAFTYTALNVNDNSVFQIIIHENLNQLDKFYEHLIKCKGHISFNGINFDYPVIHFIMCNYKKFKFLQTNEIIKLIFDEAQRVISLQNSKDFKVQSAIPVKYVKIPQLDLFRVWHFNNKARMTSLKSLEIAMNYPNVMDMPIDYRRTDISLEEVYDVILPYNLNDVEATHEFYKRSLDKIGLRKGLITKYGLPCINFPDSRIGEELVLKLYCEATGLDPYEVKQMRSERTEMALKDCIFDYIKFDTKEFNTLLDKLKNKVVTETKGSIVESVVFNGFKYDYGTGGIHGCIKPGVYESDDIYVVIDADVKCGVLTH